MDQSLSKQKQESTAAAIAKRAAAASKRTAAETAARAARTVAASIVLLMKAFDIRLVLNLRLPLCVCVCVCVHMLSRLVLLRREETELLVVYLIYNYRDLF